MKIKRFKYPKHPERHGFTWLPPVALRWALKKFPNYVATGPYWKYEKVNDGHAKRTNGWRWLTYKIPEHEIRQIEKSMP